MDYNFLTNLTLVDKGRVRIPKEKNPTGLTVRVFATGEVYPSGDLVDKFYLEYPVKEGIKPNYGIDIIDSKQWTPLAEYPRMLLFGFTPKTEAKLDLFGTCRYNEDGTPKSSVMTQGTKNEELVNLCKSFGWLTEEQKYVDLKVITEHPVKVENDLAFIPKTVQRGEKKGEATYVRREGSKFYPVEPVDLAAIQGNVQTIPVTQENELATTN